MHSVLKNRPHVLVSGMSGGGKSFWLRRLAEIEVHAGRGLALIEPHGDLSEEVLALVPRRRKNDVLYFNLLDPERCPALNPFQRVTVANRALVASHVIGAFKRLAGNSWGFRTEHVLRACILAVLETRAPTLLDVERVLVDEGFRRWVLKQVRDARVARFWTLEFPQYGRLGGEAIAAPANKLGSLLASPNVCAVLTKRRPRFDARRALDAERIIIAPTPKGLLGDEATTLGSFVIAHLLQAGMTRANIAPDARKPFTIIVDEFANYLNLAEAAQEARKFGLRLCLATQSLSALAPELRASLLSNAGHLVAFRSRGADAELLATEFVRYGPASLTSLETGERIERLAGGDARFLTATDRSLGEGRPAVLD
jgi:hypothetical protein